jgi:hypothetical protein
MNNIISTVAKKENLLIQPTGMRKNINPDSRAEIIFSQG